MRTVLHTIRRRPCSRFNSKRSSCWVKSYGSRRSPNVTIYCMAGSIHFWCVCRRVSACTFKRYANHERYGSQH